MKHFIARWLLAACVALFAGAVLAESKEEWAQHYRQGVYEVMGWNFKPMADMVKGVQPYDAAKFARHAEIVAFMSKLPLEGFIPGSDKGKTKAKPEIWKNMDDFKTKLEKMQGEVAKLAEVSKGSDFNAIKAQFGEAGKACKDCHDKYRKK